MTSAEQQAKELSEQLVLNIVLLYNGNHPGAEIIKEANKIVAAALAACARESGDDAFMEGYDQGWSHASKEIAGKLQKVAVQYGAGGHTHREKMLNALAQEILTADAESFLCGECGQVHRGRGRLDHPSRAALERAAGERA